MDLEDRLRLRELLLGNDDRVRKLAEVIQGEHADPVVQQLSAELRPVQIRLEEITDQHLPLGMPREAWNHTLAHASGFRLSAVAEYCGTDERRGDDLISELQQLLAGEVQAGQLEISYLFDCPSCGNVIDHRDDLPERPFQVFCEHGNCRAVRVIDPASADAVFTNPHCGPGLQSCL